MQSLLGLDYVHRVGQACFYDPTLPDRTHSCEQYVEPTVPSTHGEPWNVPSPGCVWVWCERQLVLAHVLEERSPCAVG